MSINKKYFYLKLKDDFYNTEDIKLLESLPNGYEYSSLYLKLCLLSLKGEGKLLYKNRIPYEKKMLATITGHGIEVIEYAIKLLEQLQMITIMDNGTIFIDDIQTLIGHGSTEAERKAKYRKKIAKLKSYPQEEGQCLGQIPPEIDIDIEKDIDIDIEIKNMGAKAPPPTLDEIKQYTQEKNYKDFDCERFYNYYEESGWKRKGGVRIKNWKQAVTNWHKNDKQWNKKKETTVGDLIGLN